MTKVLTYSTFDLIHKGHILLLQRARMRGDHLIVALSTAEFNQEQKHKVCVQPYEKRKLILKSIRFVDEEQNRKQKIQDIRNHHIDIFTMRNDWEGKFDDPKKYCQVIYLPRTDGISTTYRK